MAPIISVRKLNLWYGEKQVLEDVSLDIADKSVTAIIGPSGCGKSTLIRCMNRMNDMIDGCRIEGEILVDGQDIMSKGADVIGLRRKVGMIFQKPNPFPLSVRDNVAYGCRMAGVKRRDLLDSVVRSALERAALYEELRNRLDASALGLSGGQQQRLCIARALAMDPQVLLMDEPCSALDPIATSKIEDLVYDLKKDYTVVIVTHNMQQAFRISDMTAFMYLGKMLEYGPTKDVFQTPREAITGKYITGSLG